MPEAIDERYRLDTLDAASPAEAREFCARLAREHYENFSVVSWLVPAGLRQHYANVYAYCRISDDLADEVVDDAGSLQRLHRWRAMLHDCYAGRAAHPVFVALSETIGRFEIPVEPFDRLLDAFCRDRRQTRYDTYADLLTYCGCSANPVGHLVLYLGGYRDSERQGLADGICTGLQLANFWQDVARDWDKGRVYLPLEDMEQYGVSEEQLAARRADRAFRELIGFEVRRTRELFRAGLPLLELLTGRLRREVSLFAAGGWTILDGIDRLGGDTLTNRPTVGRAAKLSLVMRALCGARMPWQ